MYLTGFCLIKQPHWLNKQSFYLSKDYLQWHYVKFSIE